MDERITHIPSIDELGFKLKIFEGLPRAPKGRQDKRGGLRRQLGKCDPQEEDTWTNAQERHESR